MTTTTTIISTSEPNVESCCLARSFSTPFESGTNYHHFIWRKDEDGQATEIWHITTSGREFDTPQYDLISIDKARDLWVNLKAAGAKKSSYPVQSITRDQYGSRTAHTAEFPI